MNFEKDIPMPKVVNIGTAARRPNITGKKEKLHGKITTFRFRSNDSNYSIFEIVTREGDYHSVLGNVPEEVRKIGGFLDMEGFFQNNKKYGPQFNAKVIVPSQARGKSGAVSMLQVIPGVGPAKAKMLVEMFGDDIWDIIKKDPEKMMQVKGISSASCLEAQEAVEKFESLRDIYLTLYDYKLTSWQVDKIIRKYGEQSVLVVEKKPYDLQDIDGFGFARVDEIAIKVGIEPSDQARVQACIRHLMTDAQSMGGHIYHYYTELLKVSETYFTKIHRELLLRGRPVERRDIVTAIDALTEAKILEQLGPKVFSRELLNYEVVIYKYIEGAIR